MIGGAIYAAVALMLLGEAAFEPSAGWRIVFCALAFVVGIAGLVHVIVTSGERARG